MEFTDNLVLPSRARARARAWGEEYINQARVHINYYAVIHLYQSKSIYTNYSKKKTKKKPLISKLFSYGIAYFFLK